MLFGIIYFFIFGGRSPAPANYILGAILFFRAPVHARQAKREEN